MTAFTLRNMNDRKNPAEKGRNTSPSKRAGRGTETEAALTPGILWALLGRGGLRGGTLVPENDPAVQEADAEAAGHAERGQADERREHRVGLEVHSRRADEVAQPARRGDELRHHCADEPEHDRDLQAGEDMPRGRGDLDAREDVPARSRKRVHEVEQRRAG